MPYKLRKVKSKELYYVINSETKKHHSVEPLPKKFAMAQLRALYANEGIKYEDTIKKPMPSKMRFPKGSQQAKDAMAKARSVKLAKKAEATPEE